MKYLDFFNGLCDYGTITIFLPQGKVCMYVCMYVYLLNCT